MAEVAYETLSSRKLAELAYALQIDYDPDDFDRQSIIDQLHMIEKKAKLLSNEEARLLWEKQIKDKNEGTRRSTPCHEPVTIVTNKNTSLMSNQQLVFMPDTLPDNKKIYYCLDKIEDVPYLLKSGTNPFNNKPLTVEQIEFLEHSDDYDQYPHTEVGDYFDEVEKQFGPEVEEYKEKVYVKKMRELFNMITNLGFPYEAEQVLNFATDLSSEQYNFFLLHKPINQKIDGGLSRDDAAAETLNYIINYILVQKQKGMEEANKTIIQIGKAIDDFMYMTKNKLNYEQLLEARGVVEVGEVKEVFWKPNFVVEEYYPQGEIKLRYYVNEEGKKDGLFIGYYKNGNQMLKISYINGHVNGVNEIYYPTGELKSTLMYINDEKHAPEKSWYVNGKQRYIAPQDTNILIGDYDVWDDTGKFMGIKYIMYDSYENGNTKTIYFSDNGNKDGPYEEYHLNGQLAAIGFYENGEMSGFWSSWDTQQNLIYAGRYENNLKQGQWTQRTGTLNEILMEMGIYENGKKEGVWQAFYQNGKMAYEEIYQNDKLNGLKKTFHKNGNLASEGILLNYDREGVWKEWYSNGALKLEENYENGKRNGYMKEFFMDGTIKYEGNYINGNKNGLWIRYYNNGKKLSEGHFKNGIQDGVWRKWYSNGDPESEGEYKYGTEIGVWTYWDESGDPSTYNYDIVSKIISASKEYTRNQQPENISYLFFSDFLKFLNEKIPDINFDDDAVKTSITIALDPYIDPFIIDKWYREFFG